MKHVEWKLGIVLDYSAAQITETIFPLFYQIIDIYLFDHWNGLFVYHCECACVCSWLKAWMKLNACSTEYLCWLYFHGMITSTLLCGCGPWDSVNIPLYLHTVRLTETGLSDWCCIVINHLSARWHLGNKLSKFFEKGTPPPHPPTPHPYWLQLYRK